jgi:copper(I)-binding protein
MKLVVMVIYLLMVGFATFASAADPELMIHDPWVREAPPNAKVLAGYLSIMNHAKHSATLVGAKSPQFEKVELHHTVMKEGMMKMVAQDSIEIPGGKTINFEPGGFHLMLIHPVKPLKAGDKVELMLNFDEGGAMKVSAIVKKGEGGEGSAHHEHHHEHMHDQ